jgi:hypothetical protein
VCVGVCVCVCAGVRAQVVRCSVHSRRADVLPRPPPGFLLWSSSSPCSSSSGKVDHLYLFTDGVPTLGDIVHFSYNWYKEPGSQASVAPAFRLYYTNALDNTATQTGLYV